jgi:hypothetical protein
MQMLGLRCFAIQNIAKRYFAKQCWIYFLFASTALFCHDPYGPPYPPYHYGTRALLDNSYADELNLVKHVFIIIIINL